MDATADRTRKNWVAWVVAAIAIAVCAAVMIKSRRDLLSAHAEADRERTKAILTEHRRLQAQQRADAHAARLAAAEQTAAIESARAEAATGLLKEMLASGDGSRSTVAELLDAVARRLEAGEFKQEPETEASLHGAIGHAYMSLGRYAEAEKHLERALALREQSLGKSHPDTLKVRDLQDQLTEIIQAGQQPRPPE